MCFKLLWVYAVADAGLDRWFKEGVDVNKVDISEAHW